LVVVSFSPCVPYLLLISGTVTIVYKLHFLRKGNSAEVFVCFHFWNILSELDPVTESPFVVFLHGDDYVFVVVERTVLWIGLCLGKPDVATDVIVELIRPDVEGVCCDDIFLCWGVGLRRPL
jgi:hypothetical protein